MNKEETNKFIHDHELFLLETRKKFGKTPLDEDIDEYLENKRYGYGKINSPNDKINHHYFNSKKLNRGNWMNPGVDMNMSNPVNNAKNILLGYQMMNNAITLEQIMQTLINSQRMLVLTEDGQELYRGYVANF